MRPQTPLGEKTCSASKIRRACHHAVDHLGNAELCVAYKILMQQNRVIFRSKEEAEASTGYFSVSSIMITWELADKIYGFVARLSTFSQPNQAKTCYNTYTLNFTLKRYNDPEKRRAYLVKPGALGYYKHTLKSKRSRINPGHPDSYVFVQKPKEEDLKKFEDLQERTPSLGSGFITKT